MGTKIREFGRGYPDFGATLNVSSFEVYDTDHKEIKIIYLLNSTDYVYYVILNSTDYSMVKDDEGG